MEKTVVYAWEGWCCALCRCNLRQRTWEDKEKKRNAGPHEFQCSPAFRSTLDPTQVTEGQRYLVMAMLLMYPTSELVSKRNEFGTGVNAPVLEST